MAMFSSRLNLGRDATCGVFIAACSLPEIFWRTGEGSRRSIGDGCNLRFRRRGLKGNALQPTVEFLQGKLALQSMAFFAVADFAVEGGQQVESYVGGLKVLALCLRDVMDERAECRRSRGRRWLAAGCKRGRVHSRDETGRDRFDVTFDPTDLSRE